MALRNLKPRLEDPTPFSGVDAPLRSVDSPTGAGSNITQNETPPYDAFEELLAFAALSQDAHSRSALASMRRSATDSQREFPAPQFDLEEVLRLIAEHAVAITGADGAAIALAQSGEEDGKIVLRSAAGTIAPDVGARIDRDSAFSGACIRTGEMVSCDDTETDPRVNQEACRQLGARSMVAVPLGSGETVFGLLEVFSARPSAFTPQHFRNVILLADLVPGTLTPEDETRLTESGKHAMLKLEGISLEGTSMEAARVEGAASEDAPAIAEKSASANVSPALAAFESPDLVGLDFAGRDLDASADPAAEDARPTEAPIQLPVKPPVQALEEIALSEQASAGVLDQPVLEAMRAAALRRPILLYETEVPESQVPETQVPEQPRPSRRPGTFAILLCAGIAVVLVAGVWWTRSRHTTPSQKTQSKPEQESATNAAAGHAAVASARATAKNATTVAKAGSGTAANGGLPVSSASPQELQKLSRITGIVPTSGSDSTAVVVDLESVLPENQVMENHAPANQVRYESHRLSTPDRIYFDLPNTQLPHELFGKSIEFHDTFLKRIRAAQPVAGTTRIVLETHGTPGYSASMQPNPSRLVIELRAKP